MADVYQIGISISLQNGVSAVLQLITRQMLGLNHATQTAIGSMGRLKAAMLIGGAAGVFFGAEIIKGLGDLTKRGEQWVHQIELMKTAGLTFAEVQDSINAANKVSSQVLTTTPTENLKTISELRTALASADVRPNQRYDPAEATREAIAHLPTFQKITATMSSLLSKEGKPFDASTQAYELARAAETLGLSMDPKRFDAALEGWSKAIIAFQGKLTGTDFFQTAKYLRGAGPGLSIEFLTEQLPTLMQEFKTGRGGGGGGQSGGAGNPLASMFQLTVGNTISKKAFRTLEDLRLLDMSKVHAERGGGHTFDPGAVLGADLSVQNPFFYTRDFFIPALLRRYPHALDRDPTTGQLQHPTEYFGRLATLGPRTSQQMMNVMATQAARITADTAQIRRAMGPEQSYLELIRHDPPLLREAITKQWDRVLTDLGKPLVTLKTEIMYRLATALTALAEVIERYPDATKAILAITAGFAGLLTVVGSLALIVTAFTALGAAGTLVALPALVTAFVATFAVASGRMKEVFKAFADEGFWAGTRKLLEVGWEGYKQYLTMITGFIGDSLKSLGTTILGGLKSAAVALGNALSQLATMIWEWIKSLPGRLMGALTPGGLAVTPGGLRMPQTPTSATPEGAVNAAPRLPPTSQADTRGSTPNSPMYVWVNNQTSGADIARGAAAKMTSGLAGPRAGPTGFDARQTPAFSYLPAP